MANIRVDAYKTIPHEVGAVHRCLIDFEQAQPRLLRGMVRDYAILAGGIGEGTVVSGIIVVGGKERHFSFRISEPIAMKSITAYDHESHLTVSWHMRSEGPVTEVEIEAYWTEPDTSFGFVRTGWVSFLVRRMLNQILNRLPAVVEELGYHRPAPNGVPQ
jgi:hypothetical protein